MRNNPRERLLNLHRKHVKAWEQKNLDHLRDLYSGDAIVFNITPPARFSDFKTFENTLQQYFAKMKELSMLTSNIQIEVHGDVAWITSQYLMAYHLNGQLVRQNGRWTEIYYQDRVDWKLTHLHSSSDPLDQSAQEVAEDS
jgi:ketosteroid isomerase-like protein